MPALSVLAVAAHRDDVELTCGGTLAKAGAQGHRTGIIDLTRGEMGTRGSAEIREREAARAAEILGVAERVNLGLPDAGVFNTPETRTALVREIRRLQPAVVLAPALGGRHPDHRITAELVRDACFLSGLAKYAPAPGVAAHRPRKVIHCLSYREDHVKPTFVVDISVEFERKMESIRAFESQFAGAVQAGEVFPNTESLFDVLRHHAAHYGSLIRARYGEPFLTIETMRVEDVTTLAVSTF
jgi:bacillithiol biosynthesis deacetylase BshB1